MNQITGERSKRKDLKIINNNKRGKQKLQQGVKQLLLLQNKIHTESIQESNKINIFHRAGT